MSDDERPRATTARSAGDASDPSRLAVTLDSAHAPKSGSAAPPASSSRYRDYDIVGEQGRGGLGRVVRANDRRLARVVAVKELLEVAAESTVRFLREARLTARLQHPSIVPVYELGFRSDGAPFYAMKLIEGERLDEVIARRRSLDERIALVPNVLAVAEAVAYAHEHRIIHRDLKPSNVILGAFGETVVIDWGLAKDLNEVAPIERATSPAERETAVRTMALDATVPAASDPASSDRTRTGHAMGTLGYMPPEQFRGAHVDERADVFSLGATLYQLVTGSAPYVEGSVKEVSDRVANASPEPIEAREPGVPKELAAIVKKAMAKEPADRYPTAKELAADLRSFQTGQLVSAHHYSRGVLAARWMSRYRKTLGTVALFVAVIAAMGTISLRRVVHERDRAEAQSGRADTERSRANEERSVAERRAMELTLVEAKTSLDRDPTASLAWLKTYPEDGPEWNALPAIAADAIQRGVALHVLRGHEGPAVKLAISPDGKTIASGGDNKSVRLWDLGTGNALGVYPQIGTASILEFAPDGSALYSAGEDGNLLVVDLRSRTSRAIPVHRGGIGAFVPALDRKQYATCGDDGSVRVGAWASDASTILGSHAGACVSAAFSPDSARLATTGTDGRLRIWDTRRGGEVESFVLARGEVPTRVAWSADGRHVAITDPSAALRMFDLDARTSWPLVGHEGEVDGIAFTPDGTRLVSIGRDSTVRLWDAATRAPLRVLYGHSALVEDMAFSTDGARLVTCSEDATVRVWDLASGESRALRGHTSTVQACLFSPDGTWVVSGSGDATVRVWDVREAPETVLRGHLHDVLSVAWSPDGARLASGSHDSTVRVWNPHTGAQEAVLTGHQGMVWRLAFLGPSGERLASGAWDHTVRVWDLASGTSRVFAHDDDVSDLVATRDGATVISSSDDGAVRIWDAATGASRVLRGHVGRVNRVALSPDEATIASVGQDATVRLWDRATGDARAVLRGHADELWSVAFSPDGSTLASAGWDKIVRVWDARTGNQLRALEGHTDRVLKLVFAKDGAHVASAGSDTTVRWWGLATGTATVLEGHTGSIRTLVLSPDGSLLASGGNDATTRVWDVATGRARAVFRSAGPVVSAAFSPDGSLIASGGWDAKVRVRPIDAASLLPTDGLGFRAWLDVRTTAVVDARGNLSSPRAP